MATTHSEGGRTNISFQTLRPQLKTLLDNTSLFVEVSGTPKLEFSGYPAAYVVQSDNSSDYDTTRDNERVYAFSIRIFYSTKSIGVASALSRLEQTVDDVLDALDKDSIKPVATRVVGVSMPTGYTWINTFSVPSSFGEIDGEQLLTAEIGVRVRVLFNTTS